MQRSIVPLPPQIRSPFEVYVNGVKQHAGSDYQVRDGALVYMLERRDIENRDAYAIATELIGAAHQDGLCLVILRSENGVPAGFDDSRFLGGDCRERITEKFLMVEGNRGNACSYRIDHIGRIKSSAKSHF